MQAAYEAVADPFHDRAEETPRGASHKRLTAIFASFLALFLLLAYAATTSTSTPAVSVDHDVVNIFQPSSFKFAPQDQRFTTHLLLDKPVYRPGETIRASCFVLNSFDLTKPLLEMQGGAQATIKDAKGVQIASFYIADMEHGVWSVQYKLPVDIHAGGEFTLEIDPHVADTISRVERKFELRATRTANNKVNKRLEFERQGYRAGDVVQCELTAEGGAAVVVFVATVDSIEVARSQEIMLVKNKASFQFTLPAHATNSVLVAKVRSSSSAVGSWESVSKTVPIVNGELDLHVYPESGELLRGVAQQRIYVQARDHMTFKPVDFVGHVYVDAKRVGTVSSVHEGRGLSTRFDIPFNAQNVYVELVSPQIQRTAQIPLLNKKITFSTEQSVFTNVLEVSIHTSLQQQQLESFTLGLYQRDVEIAKQQAAITSQIKFNLEENLEAYGVLRLTLFDHVNKVPLAERLVFRAPPRAIEFDFSAQVVDGQQQRGGLVSNTLLKAQPSDGIQVTVRSWARKLNMVTGELEGDRMPIKATVALRVTDSALAATVDERMLPARLPELVLLESELADVSDAGAYLPSARWSWINNQPTRRGTFAQRIDLLLGTQGWRRFAYSDAEAFVNNNNNKQSDLIREVKQIQRERVLAMRQRQNTIMYQFAEAFVPPKVMMVKGAPRVQFEMMAAEMAAEEDVASIEDDDVAYVEEEERPLPPNQIPVADRIQARPAFAAKRRAAPPTEFARVFALPQRKYTKKELLGGEPVQRTDFTETVYFNPSLVTQCNNNKVCSATVTFGLSDSSSAWFVAHADGFAHKQALVGAGQMRIRAEVENEVDFKLPSIVVQGDLPKISISTTTGASFVSSAPRRLATQQQRGSKVFELQQGGEFGMVNFTLTSKHDSITRSTIVVPRGFPAKQFVSGTLTTSKRHVLDSLPQDYVEGSLQVSAVVYISPIGQLTKALEALIREPFGCFEQASSTTYPLVFVLQYLKTHALTDRDGELVRRATEMLTKGYAKLQAYESPGGGFEWFGASPGHEALTAYGLLQFAAMQDAGIPVDANMVERTKQWMETKRDGFGGFLRNPQALDSFGAAPESTTNAYITWALVRAKMLRARTKELNSLVRLAKQNNDDAYLIALASLSLYEAEKTAENLKQAEEFAGRLQEMQDKSAGFVVAKDTITRSRGDALKIESTALAVMAWLNNVEVFGFNAQLGVEYLQSMCKDGSFASTQATALTLMAIVEFDRVFAKPALPKDATVQIWVNNELVDERPVGDKAACKGKHAFWNECASACAPVKCGEDVPFICTAQCVAKCDCPPEQPWLTDNGDCIADCNAPSAEGEEEQQGVVRFSSTKLAAKLLEVGKAQRPEVELRLVAKGDDNVAAATSLPYSVALKYSVDKPVSSTSVALQVEVEPLGTAGTKLITEGDVITLQVRVRNTDLKSALPMIVCQVGIPGGFEPRTDQLLYELKRLVDFVEAGPGVITLYWRALQPGAEITIPVQVTAAVAGKYQAPSTRAYLFYNNEEIVWAKGYEVEITN